MKTGQPKALPIIQALRMVACFSMVGCVQSAPTPLPVAVNVYQACDVDPEAWKQVTIPQEREALLELKTDQAGTATREDFILSGDRMESWFENSSRDLLACRYRRQEDCGGDVLSTVIFRRSGEFWKAEPTRTRICAD